MDFSRTIYLTAFCLLIMNGLLASHHAYANASGVFTQGRTHFAIYGGNGYAFGDDYLVVGIRGSYYLANGFNIGLGAESWTGGSPRIYKVTPSIQYVFYQPSTIKPYLGTFYQRTYIENLEDLESTGVRAGVYIASGGNLYIGLGGVYESYLDCEETIYKSCDDSYPEITFTFAF